MKVRKPHSKTVIRWLASNSDTAAPVHSMHASSQKQLYQVLAQLHKRYSPFVKLLKTEYSPHSFLPIFRGWPVHPTRESVEYAVMLLKTQDLELHKRAVSILTKVVNLQITNPNSQHCGLWPKYLEEWPFKVIRPDRNWADFIAIQLLQVALTYRQSIPSKLLNKIDAAVLQAAQAIKQRNVSLAYTNIAITGIYVTLIVGQTYNRQDLQEYGVSRLHAFYQERISQHDFCEYNSPTYTIIVLEILGRLRLHLKHLESKTITDSLYKLTWKHIAHYFHPPTGQWSGPHSRSYSVLLKPGILALFERLTSNSVQLPVEANTIAPLAAYQIPLNCPPELESYFISLKQARSVVKSLGSGHSRKVMTTYLHPSFSLGTISYSDCWHQRQPLIAYWGSPEKVGYLRVRVLHNRKDFAAALFSSKQTEGDVLAAISFAQDINSYNPYLSPKEVVPSVVPVKDLRLRFEFGGEARKASQIRIPSNLECPICFNLDELQFQIEVPHAKFGGSAPYKWEINQESSNVCLDLVLYSGKAKKICLSSLEYASVGFALRIATIHDSIPISSVAVSEVNNLLIMNWNSLSLKSWLKPELQSEIP